MPGLATDAFVLWLLPGLFLLHELEETVWLPRWLHRNRKLLAVRFPRLAVRLLPHAARLGRRAFALMAGEELLILMGITAYAYRTGHCAPWLALFLAFTFHLCLHLGQALALRRPFPATATSVCFLPLCGWMLYRMAAPFTGTELAACAVAGVAGAGLNLWLLHRLAGRLCRRARERRFTAYDGGSG